MQKIFIIGGTTYDHIITLDEFPQPVPQTIHKAPFNETTGSTGSGKALCMQKLNIPNTLYSIVGNDIYGKRIIEHLSNEKVNFIYDFDPKGTERHINIMDNNGGRISMFVTQSSEHPQMSIDVIKQEIDAADIIVLNIISYCKEIIPLVKEANKPVWTDLHDYTDDNPYHESFIETAQYILLSSDNLDDYKKVMKKLIARGKELVVCTHGKDGATALDKEGNWFEQNALTDIKVVDSNGAGDNFFSGYLYAHLQGKTIQECLQFGTICGALCVKSKQLVHEQLSPAFVNDCLNKEIGFIA